jgi:hypothetical protein
MSDIPDGDEPTIHHHLAESKVTVSFMSKSCDDMATPPNSSLVLSGQKALENS